MELLNETNRMELVSRAIAFGLAFATTAFVATSTAVVFTGNTHVVGAAVGRVAIAPILALLGL